MKGKLLDIITVIGLSFGLLWAVDGDPARVDKLINELHHARVGDVYSLDEPDLNAFIQRELTRQPKPEVKELRVRFNEGTFTTFLTVDMDQLKLQDESTTTGFLKTLLRGVQEIEVEGSLQIAQDGRAVYETRQASLNGFPLPATMVDMILSSVGKKQKPPFDPTQPFAMPYGINDVDFQKGKARLGIK